MGILQSDEIKKEYYTPKEVCYLINTELQLHGNNIITPNDLTNWRKIGMIKWFKKSTISKKEYNHILGFAFLHIYLGIEYKSIERVKEYLSTQVVLIESKFTDTPHIKKYINLWQKK